MLFSSMVAKPDPITLFLIKLSMLLLSRTSGQKAKAENSRTPRLEIKKLYTLSLVCGSSEYPLEVEVNDHYIILYELDGYPVDTQKTRRLYLQSGETAKIGLEQIDTKSDSYFFRVSLPGNKR